MNLLFGADSQIIFSSKDHRDESDDGRSASRRVLDDKSEPLHGNVVGRLLMPACKSSVLE